MSSPSPLGYLPTNKPFYARLSDWKSRPDDKVEKGGRVAPDCAKSVFTWLTTEVE